MVSREGGSDAGDSWNTVGGNDNLPTYTDATPSYGVSGIPSYDATYNGQLSDFNYANTAQPVMSPYTGQWTGVTNYGQQPEATQNLLAPPGEGGAPSLDSIRFPGTPYFMNGGNPGFDESSPAVGLGNPPEVDQ